MYDHGATELLQEEAVLNSHRPQLIYKVQHAHSRYLTSKVYKEPRAMKI